MNDGELQLSYDLPEYANTNRWTNLFVDRTAAVNAISDSEILSYVRNGNYTDSAGNIILAKTLSNVPPSGWDYDKNGQWDGYSPPDCYFKFDSEGFDKAPDGSYTGWRAFAYAPPFLGTFWPTNGSTDDVIIRLSETFRKNANGAFDKTAYKINLAIVESMIKRSDVYIDPVNENIYGVDLDKDGTLGTASKIKYKWNPLVGGDYMHFVGYAKTAQEAGNIEMAAGLFPQGGTEFLHSVRYIDVTDDNDIALAPRFKELRYAKKKSYKNYGVLKEIADEEMKETYDFPDRLSEYFGDVERGVSNSQGWVYQGFIEDKSGNLRPQTYEETVFFVWGGVTEIPVLPPTVFMLSPESMTQILTRGGVGIIGRKRV